MRNTNMIKQTFEYFIDLSTSDVQASVVKIKAGGEYVKQRLMPFFTAFKYYKLGSVKVKMVPASTLPVDPTGLSYEAGEPTVDPRDMMNPGLVRITNGEDTATDGFQISNESYMALCVDPRWFKFRLQSGFSRRAVPLFWEVGQLHQDNFPGNIVNRPYVASGQSDAHPRVGVGREFDNIYGSGSGDPEIMNKHQGYLEDFTDPHGFFQIGKRAKMGWMPTDFSQMLPDLMWRDGKGEVHTGLVSSGDIAPIPEVELLTFILPQAYKTKFYYRLYIQESVYFKAPVANHINVSGEGVFAHVSENQTVDRAIFPSFEKTFMGGQTAFIPNGNPSECDNDGSGEKDDFL